jgi:hypothetical protein
MTFTRIILPAVLSLVLCGTARSQADYADNRVRVLLNTEVGSETELGYDFPAVAAGPSVEIPIAQRFEFDGGGAYSPDKKRVTNNGDVANVSGSAIGFATQRLGFVAGLQRGWLWTSEFDKRTWMPSAGVVLRNNYLGHGRFYLTYIFPTGCVSATPNNPCTIQSNRLQGLTIRQETRSMMHTRWGFESGLYHFCNESNPNEPQSPRSCRMGVSGLVTLSFEFHAGSKPRIVRADAADSDNF